MRIVLPSLAILMFILGARDVSAAPNPDDIESSPIPGIEWWKGPYELIRRGSTCVAADPKTKALLCLDDRSDDEPYRGVWIAVDAPSAADLQWVELQRGEETIDAAVNELVKPLGKRRRALAPLLDRYMGEASNLPRKAASQALTVVLETTRVSVIESNRAASAVVPTLADATELHVEVHALGTRWLVIIATQERGLAAHWLVLDPKDPTQALPATLTTEVVSVMRARCLDRFQCLSSETAFLNLEKICTGTLDEAAMAALVADLAAFRVWDNDLVAMFNIAGAAYGYVFKREKWLNTFFYGDEGVPADWLPHSCRRLVKSVASAKAVPAAVTRGTNAVRALWKSRPKED